MMESIAATLRGAIKRMDPDCWLDVFLVFIYARVMLSDRYGPLVYARHAEQIRAAIRAAMDRERSLAIRQ